MVTLEPATGKTRAAAANGRGRVFKLKKGAAPEAGPEIRTMAGPRAREAEAPKDVGAGTVTRLPLDPALAALLEEGRAAGWRDRSVVERLESLLGSMGVRVAGVERVILSGGGAELNTGRKVEIWQQGPVLHLVISPDKD
jgi:hypothetical protein